MSTLRYLSRMKSAAVYRRRRLGALLAVSATACLLYAGADAGAESRPVPYTVRAGDTLWSIATEHYPSSEAPRANVEAIREENGLEGSTIRPGAGLDLPG